MFRGLDNWLSRVPSYCKEQDKKPKEQILRIYTTGRDNMAAPGSTSSFKEKAFAAAKNV